MENFGYLEMAIAQENSRQPNQNNASTDTPQHHRLRQPKNNTPPCTMEHQESEKLQVVGFWGLF